MKRTTKLLRKQNRLPKQKLCTKRQQKFVEEYVRNGQNVVEAYKAAFSTQNGRTAYCEGMRLLKVPWIVTELNKHHKTLEAHAVKLGMDDETLLKQHRKLIFATNKIYDKETGEVIREEDDLPSIKSGLELIYKLLGKFAAERKQLEGPGGKPLFPESDLSSLNKEDLMKKRDEVLKALQDI